MSPLPESLPGAGQPPDATLGASLQSDTRHETRRNQANDRRDRGLRHPELPFLNTGFTRTRPEAGIGDC